MPVSLSFWSSGHICPTSVSWTYHCANPSNGILVDNNDKAYIPSTPQSAIDGGKSAFKTYVLKFFNVKKLSECVECLQEVFCEPVAKLIQEIALTLDKSTNRNNLLCLLRLYADYYRLDAVWNHSQKDFIETTRRMVSLLRACYLNYGRWQSADQEWLCALLDNLGENYYTTENLHTYCIQSRDLLAGFRYIRRRGTRGRLLDRQIRDKGLAEVWKFNGSVPLPLRTWDDFSTYAGKRLSLHNETMCFVLGIKGYSGLMAYKRREFFSIPCACTVNRNFEKRLISLDRVCETKGKADNSDKEFDVPRKRSGSVDFSRWIFRRKEKRKKGWMESEIRILPEEAEEEETEDLSTVPNNHKIFDPKEKRKKTGTAMGARILSGRLDIFLDDDEDDCEDDEGEDCKSEEDGIMKEI